MSRWKMTRNIAVSDKLQIPSSKLQRITKLQGQKPACAPLAPASAFGFWGLRSGTSLALGVWCLAFGVWCLVFRSAAAQKLVPLVGLDAIEHFARAARRSRHAERGVQEVRLERCRTVGRPSRAQIRRIEQ